MIDPIPPELGNSLWNFLTKKQTFLLNSLSSPRPFTVFLLMSVSETEPPSSPTYYYAPLPSQHEQGFIASPFYDPPANPRRRRWSIISVAFVLSFLLLLSGIVYLLWPTEPTLQIVRLRLHRIHIHTVPIVSLDVSMNATIEVRNVDVYSVDIQSLDVVVRYRGRKLGEVRSDQGHVRAFATSYVNAELNFYGVRFLTDVLPLLEDFAKGSLPLDAVTEIAGRLGLLFFGFPLKAKLLCAVLVNIKTQTIVRQRCFPEALSSSNLIQSTVTSSDLPVAGAPATPNSTV